ncbi:MAG: TerC family protein [Actinobacteria bacterium]|nr:TerC family protein [Actinomycetota bacterium]
MRLLGQVDPSGEAFAVPAWAWAAFLALVLGLIVFDLVLHRDDHEISMKEAAWWSVFWIALSLLFGGVVWVGLGNDAAAQYLTGYVIEKSLSVDNVFVWAVILGYFAVPNKLQHRVLFWGIFGALVLRAVFIFAGIALLNRLEWLTLVFGAFLIFTAVRVFRHDNSEIHPEKNPVLRFIRRRVPVTDDYVGHDFFTKRDGKRWATPLLVVLVMVEATDVVFAVDSIPAILAVSRSQFIVFSSNAFAILGLRSLYFVLAGARDKLVHLNKGLGIVLFFVGVKMVLAQWGIHIPTMLSLLVITLVLAVTVIWSLLSVKRHPEMVTDTAETPEPQPPEPSRTPPADDD